MIIIRYPYLHQWKRVIVIVYWSEYPDEVIQTVLDWFLQCVNVLLLTVLDWFPQCVNRLLHTVLDWFLQCVNCLLQTVLDWFPQCVNCLLQTMLDWFPQCVNCLLHTVLDWFLQCVNVLLQTVLDWFPQCQHLVITQSGYWGWVHYMYTGVSIFNLNWPTSKICVIDSLVQILHNSFHHCHTGKMAHWAKQWTYLSNFMSEGSKPEQLYIFIYHFFVFYMK